jgi:hypothetical protein
MYLSNAGHTYTEGLQVIDGQLVAEKVEESILEHASVPVAKLRVSEFIASCPAKIHADLAKQRNLPETLVSSSRPHLHARCS